MLTDAIKTFHNAVFRFGNVQFCGMRLMSPFWALQGWAQAHVMEQSLISVVIPAYNEEKTIGSVISGTISSLEGLRLPFEVIVVDDGSTDSMRRVATQYKATV